VLWRANVRSTDTTASSSWQRIRAKSINHCAISLLLCAGTGRLMFDWLLSEHEEVLTAACLDHRQRRLVTGDHGGAVKVWNFHTGLSTRARRHARRDRCGEGATEFRLDTLLLSWAHLPPISMPSRFGWHGMHRRKTVSIFPFLAPALPRPRRLAPLPGTCIRTIGPPRGTEISGLFYMPSWMAMPLVAVGWDRKARPTSHPTHLSLLKWGCVVRARR